MKKKNAKSIKKKQITITKISKAKRQKRHGKNRHHVSNETNRRTHTKKIERKDMNTLKANTHTKLRLRKKEPTNKEQKILNKKKINENMEKKQQEKKKIKD